jgi:hypothetical protein
MEVLNAMQLKNGAKAKYNKMGTITQPVQFIPEKDKDEEWHAWNLDWLEWNGMKQIRRNARRLMKNYKLAKGIIDKTDYIIQEDNEYTELIDQLTEEDTTALELKFYPIIPNVINVLVSEFAQRTSKLSFRATDEYSYNDLFEQKYDLIQQNLLANAEQKIMTSMIQAGIPQDDPMFKQAMDPQNIKTLPEVEEFIRKDYRGLSEQWASHQHAVDQERFRMEELEERGFRDMLITDREFWHFHMMEDDYNIELWNPVLTFYHKSPDTRYVSQGNWVGKIDMLSVSDVIDKYGWMMNEDQLKSLESIYPIRSAGYAVNGYQNDGSYYDATRSHDWNVNQPSLQYRQYMSAYTNSIFGGGDIVNWIMSESEDYFDLGMSHLLRCCTIYWKSQRRVGHLTKICDNGEVIVDVVDESYKVTDKPIYDTSLFKTKTKDNLAFGEHIDWIWINEVRGGVKIGPNHPSFWGMNNPGGINPIYLGVMANKPGRMKFQFRGDKTLYGCKLPVEGAVFSDRNTRSTALVDLMKPFQIGYNIVNNQIADILVDELGTVIVLDQNALPRHSMGEDWGKNNFAKAFVAMKNFQMLPLDTTITNTENALNFQHFQKLDLEQTNRLMSRVNLATYFKTQAFEVIGITPTRLGQQIGRQTAKGVEENLNASYAQTETYFIQHCDYLMPRVHQMRTDVAQYYHSTKPSVTLQYMTSADEKINFQINGTQMLLWELNVFPSTNANHRNTLEKLKALAEQNNTAGATIYDLGRIEQAETMAELNSALEVIEKKQQENLQQQQQHEMDVQNQKLQAENMEKEAQREFQAAEAEKNRRRDILVAEIRSAGYGAMMDIDKNQQSDYQDELANIQQSQEFKDQMNLQTSKEGNRMTQHADKMDIEREKLQTQREIADKQLEIARENKNKFDKPQSKSSTKKK